jgi:hypothetical protein
VPLEVYDPKGRTPMTEHLLKACRVDNEARINAEDDLRKAVEDH